jgi:hypothetical protein
VHGIYIYVFEVFYLWWGNLKPVALWGNSNPINLNTMRRRTQTRPSLDVMQCIVLFVWSLLFVSYGAFGQNDMKRVPIDNNAMIYVPQQDKLFVTTPSGPSSGNSLCVIDPYFGTIDTCYFIGSEPGVMAVSGDGMYIYIGLTGAPRIVRFNLFTKEVDAQVNLGSSGVTGSFYADDIEVLPGSSTSFVVSRRNQGFSPRHEGLAVYDGTIRRPNTTPGHTGSNTIAFASNGQLFGYNNETTEYGFRRLIITENGVSELAVYTGLVNNFSTEIESQGNRIYSSRGHVVDVSTPTPNLVGIFSNLGGFPVMEVSPDSNYVYFITSSWSEPQYKFEKYNKTTFNKISSEPLAGISGGLKSLINWGTEGKLAFNTDKLVVIMRNCTSLLTSPLEMPSNAGGCTGTEVTLSAPEGLNSYFWSNGAVGQTILVSQQGQYSVQATDSLGCLGPPSNIVSVQFDWPPSAPWISGSSLVRICQGGGVTLSTFGSGNDSYMWSNGGSGTSITVNQPGQYRVRAISPNGCVGNYSQPVTVELLPEAVPPRPVIEVLGSTTFCSGDSVILSAPEGYHSYTWSNSNGARSITVKNTGIFTVRVGNPLGCMSETSLPVSVTVFPVPAQPTILANGNLLASSAVSGNQWFLNGDPIQGATGRFYVATLSGFYSVQVTINGCSSTMSNLYNHFVVSTSSLSDDVSMMAFPNPAWDFVYLKMNDESNTMCEVFIYNLTGRMIYSETCHFESGTVRLEIGHLSSGVYWLEALDHVGKIRKRLKLVKI